MSSVRLRCPTYFITGLVLLAVTAALHLGGTEARAGAASHPVILAAGDIAECGSADSRRTGAILARFPRATVVTLGDNAYEVGSPAEFRNCYAPAWGAAKARTRPSVGNHDYGTANAAGYFGYFGKAAGHRRHGYYSFRLGDWHLVALNSNCSEVDGCGRGSRQIRWLRRTLNRHAGECTLAYWHHPRFSSGVHGNDRRFRRIWEVLYRHGVDVVLNGHDHDYERFAPQTPYGRFDPGRGIRQFVVGTGGRGLRDFPRIARNSRVRNDDTHGVLKLVLRPGSYEWKFLPEAGRTFTDEGSAECH